MKISSELEQRIREIELEQERQDSELDEFLRDLVEVIRLEAELAKMSDEEILALVKRIKEDEKETVVEPEPPPPPVAKGYVVCLLFNPKIPTEWSEESGGGWREQGQGTRYPVSEEAQQRLQLLQKKWPDYPMKVFYR